MRSRKRTTRVLELGHIYLPPEIWRQILARLPPKTLMQFRCVCKNWRSLIDDSDFISMHFNLYTNCHANTQLLLTVERGQRSSSSSSPLTTFTLRRSDTFRKKSQLCQYLKSHVLRGSYLVNGLLLLSNMDNFTLFNPSIRKSLTLPSCPRRFGLLRFLGYAPSSADYKVVVLNTSDAIPFGMAVAVYSLRDHCWSEHVMQVPQWAFDFMRSGYGGFIYFHGAVYLRPSPRRKYALDTQLVSFDFESETFHYLSLPDVNEEMRIFVLVFGDSLAVFGISRVRTCIWVLELEKNAGNEPWRQCWNGDTSLYLYNLLKNFQCQIIYIEHTGTLLFKKSNKLVAYSITSNQPKHLLNKISFFIRGYLCGELGVAQRIRKCRTTVQNCRC